MATLARLIQTEDLDGALNMALDEVLWTESARSVAFVRLYGWADRPVLSLGYFQDAGQVRRDPRLRNLPFVRRLTGGGAIVHDHELTFSLGLPANLAGKSSELYRCVHHAMAESLAEIGIPASVANSSRPPSATANLCFQRADRFAVRVRGIKVLGSAQRRRPQSVLMHGSLILASSSAAPEVLGLRELLDAELPAESLREAMTRAIESALELELQPTELPPDLLLKAISLADSKYRTAAWNDRARAIQPKSCDASPQPALAGASR